MELRPLPGSTAPSPAGNSGALPSTSPTPALPAPSTAAGRLLLQEDFTQPDPGWQPYSGEFGVVETSKGILRLVAAPAKAGLHTTIWAINRTISARDAVIEVEVVRQQGKDAAYGLICRFEDRNNFYEFDISTSGTYGIGATIAGEPKWLGESDAGPNSSILLGKAVNRIRAECVGDRLTLYVNGRRLLVVTDRSVESGRAGVIVNNNSPDSPAELLFDNYLVRSASTP